MPGTQVLEAEEPRTSRTSLLC